MRQGAVLVGLLGSRVVLDNRHTTDLGALNHVVTRNEMDHLGTQLGSQGFDQLVFAVGVTAVADQACQTHAAGVGVFHDALGDVVGRVHGHHLAGNHDVDFLCLVLADRHGEATAHNVTEYVVENKVEVFLVGAFLFEEVDRGDNTTTGAAHTRLRTTGLNALDVAVAGLQNVFQFQVFNGASLGSHFHDGVLRFRVQNKTGGVGLRIAADDHDFLTQFGEAGNQVLSGGGFTDTTLTVDCTLTQ